MDVSNVTAGTPKVAGYLYVAPMGTPLPADCTSELDEAFEGLGYITSDGITQKMTNGSTVNDWSGSAIYTFDGKEEFSFTLAEALRIGVLKLRYGRNNVSGSLGTGLTVHVDVSSDTPKSYVCEMMLRGNTMKRIVIPEGLITNKGDTVYKSDGLITYPITVEARKGADGFTHHEYMRTVSSSMDESEE